MKLMLTRSSAALSRDSRAARRTRAGFSLTEVMISVLVVAACIAPLFFLYSQGTTGTIRSRDEVLAFSMAMDLLDYARSKSYTDPFLAPCSKQDMEVIAIPVGANSITLGVTDPAKFKRTITIEEKLVAQSPFAYKIIVAEVEWNAGGGGGGGIRSIAMSGLMYGKAP